MKPVSIAMQAFGPYLKKQEISFEDLNRCRIFLISGPTGGGKTSILDAMSVALFGEATGGQRSFAEMRTNTAPEKTDTEVSFTFSLGEKRYRFERRIHPYRKRNGSLELRMEAASAKWEAGAWTPMESSSPKAVTKKAEELLGLTFQQFAQMMILPQGEFRKLLLASSAEKEKILEKLFLTRRWIQISEAVASLASRQQKELEKMLTERTALLRQQEAGSLEEFCQKVRQQADLTGLAQGEAEAAGMTFKKAEQAWNQARQAADIQAKWRAAKEKREQLAQQQEEMENLSNRLTQAKLIREVTPFYQAHCKSFRGFRQREQELIQAKGALASAQKQAAFLPEYRCALDSAVKEREEAVHAISELRPLLEQAELLEKLKQQAALLAEKAAQQEECTKQAEQRSNLLLEQLRQAEEWEKDIQYEAEKLPELHAALQRCKERREEYNSLAAASKSVAEAKGRLTEAEAADKRIRTRLAVFRQQLEQMETEWKTHTAAQLALGLQEGKPCPVCGAVHHPQPARQPEGISTQEQIQLLREEIAQEEKQAQQAAAQLVQAKSMAESTRLLFQTMQERCARFDENQEENQQRISQLTEQIERLASSEQQRDQAHQQIEQIKEKSRAAAGTLEQSRQDGRRLEIDLATVSGQINATEKQLPQEDAALLRKREASLQETIRFLQNHTQQQQERIRRIETEKVQAEERYSAAQNAYRTAEQESQDAMELWEKESTARGLDLEVFLQNQESREPLEQWEERLHQFHTALQYWERQEAQLREEASAHPAVDLAQAEQQYRSAQAEKTKADERLGEERARKSQLDALYNRLETLEKQTAGLEEETGRFQKMNQLLSGKNSRKTPLHQFVLGLMLDGILQSANVYLNRLSGGRYQMNRREGEISGGGYKGLELEICDGYQGGSRPVGTLSGGEMFLASLSLAFGLADVVQRDAGGIRLDSIFIDEGFGTLDRETREAVMQSLAQIRASGRVVGLISHVEELRDVIPARIEVRKDNAGQSGLSVVCPETSFYNV